MIGDGQVNSTFGPTVSGGICKSGVKQVRSNSRQKVVLSRLYSVVCIFAHAECEQGSYFLSRH